jgi:putative transcriptional regulator
VAERTLLVELRKQKGWFQQDVARQVEISVSQYSMIENCERNPSIVVAFRIARLFGVAVETLFPDL